MIIHIDAGRPMFITKRPLCKISSFALVKASRRVKKKNSKAQCSLLLGPPELQIIKELEYLPPNTIKTTSSAKKNEEILCRGLHSARYLMEVDEKVLLQLLHEYLTSFNKSSSLEDLAIAKNLAFSIYATMISKYGVFNADSFGNVPMELKLFERAMGEQQMSAKSSGGLPLTSYYDSLQKQQQPDSVCVVRKGIEEIADIISEVYLAR